MLTYLVSLASADPTIGAAIYHDREARSTELSDELSRRIDALEKGEPGIELAMARLEAFDPEGAIEAFDDETVRAHALAMQWDFAAAVELWPGGDTDERRRWDAARRIQRGDPSDTGDAIQVVRGCLDKLSGTRPQLIYEECLGAELAAVITADVIPEQVDWAKVEMARRLREVFVEDSFRSLKGYRLESGGHPNSVYVWTLSEVYVSSQMFDQVAADKLCAIGCGDLPLGQTWRSLDGDDRQALTERLDTLPLIQHYRIALMEEEGATRVQDVFLLDSEPLVDSLSVLCRERRYRDPLLGFGAIPMEEGPEELSTSLPSAGILTTVLTWLAVLGILVGMGLVWFRGRR